MTTEKKRNSSFTLYGTLYACVFHGRCLTAGLYVIFYGCYRAGWGYGCVLDANLEVMVTNVGQDTGYPNISPYFILPSS
jgi:hypothetical protein